MTLDEVMKAITNYGVLFTLFAGLVLLAKLYLPKFIDAHLSLVETLKINTTKLTENQDKLTENSEKLTQTVIAQSKDLGHCKTTSSALLGFVDVFDTAVEGHPNADRVKPKLAAIKSVLTDIPPK